MTSKDQEHRITILETMFTAMADSIRKIEASVSAYGFVMAVTMVMGFAGIIITVWAK